MHGEQGDEGPEPPGSTILWTNYRRISAAPRSAAASIATSSKSLGTITPLWGTWRWEKCHRARDTPSARYTMVGRETPDCGEERRWACNERRRRTTRPRPKRGRAALPAPPQQSGSKGTLQQGSAARPASRASAGTGHLSPCQSAKMHEKRTTNSFLWGDPTTECP